ncbi:3-oxoacyl-[acyl-carrier-protein] synthase 2 [Serratia fonticola]|uniref:3-oxoacyl-[acyl-carrier-protein] synthase 2 n=1 Tax=Serratia fonticola TaxID=47917 RepID=A0A4U9VC50_SERFO|nr:3-oxoacyl-[acyl-carrier-protein] synthase 2 [Serratia fonticola]
MRTAPLRHSTSLNETQAIKLAFGEAAYSTPLSSTKSYSGHLIAAAGSFESIICLQALQHQLIPATCHLKNGWTRSAIWITSAKGTVRPGYRTS